MQLADRGTAASKRVAASGDHAGSPQPILQNWQQSSRLTLAFSEIHAHFVTTRSNLGATRLGWVRWTARHVRMIRVELVRRNAAIIRVRHWIWIRNRLMYISHLTRIAFNLSLIVAMAFQPVAVCLASVDCTGGCSQASPACGCCHAGRSGNRCCCGVGKSQSSAQGGSLCCGKADDASVPIETPGADGSSQVNPLLVSADESAARSVCLCEQDASPFGDSGPRRGTIDNRDTVLLAWTALDFSGGKGVPTAPYGPALPVPSHHSQLMLCIWRL